MTAWRGYEPARGGGGWYVVEQLPGDRVLECCVILGDRPVTARICSYGPRGGRTVWWSGTAGQAEEYRRDLVRAIQAIGLLTHYREADRHRRPR